jgi:redox-sensitive bicupin YhaK (pirin superfamily)
MEKTVYHPSSGRGHADHGWLNAHHSFSFAGFYDASKIHFGALRVLNDDIIAGGSGFGMHPHDNMEIITIMLRGALEHKDSMNNVGVIEENEVQVMSAGTGVHHSEYNHSKDKDANLLQIWIFPEKRNVTPRYDQRKFDIGNNTLQVIVSPVDSNDEGLKIHQQAWIYRGKLQKGSTVEQALHGENKGVYVFLIDGSVAVNGQKLQKRDAAGISGSQQIKIEADADSDVLVLEVPMTI